MILDKRVRLGFIFLILVILPFANYNGLIEAGLIPKFLFLSIALLFLCAYTVFRPHISYIRPGALSLICSGLLISVSLSLIYTKDLGANLMELNRLFSYALLVFLIIALYPNSDDEPFKDLLVVSIIGSLIFAIIGALQFVILVLNEPEISHQDTYRIQGVFMNRNLFIQYLSLLLPLNIYPVYTKHKYWVTALIASCLSIILLIICQVRSVWFGIVLCGAILLVMQLKRLRLNSKKTLITGLSLILLISGSIGIYSIFGEANSFSKQIESAFNFRYSSVEERKHLWGNSLQMISENPLKGVGVGSWKIDHMKHGMIKTKAMDGNTFYQRPHNDFLWVASEQGIIAGLIYISLFVVLLVYSIRIIKVSRVKGLSLFASVFLFIIYSSLSFPKERVEHGLVFCLLVSVILIISHKKRALLNSKLILIAIPVLILGVLLSLIRLKVERNIKLGTSFVELENKKEVLNNLYTYTPTSMPVNWLVGFDHFRKAEIDSAERYFSKALIDAPFNPQVLNSNAVILFQKGQNESSKSLLREAVRVAPMYDEAFLNLSMIYIKENKLDTAGYYFMQVQEPENNPNFLKIKKLLNL